MRKLNDIEFDAGVVPPSAPATGLVGISGMSVAGRSMLAVGMPGEGAEPVQLLLARQKIGLWMPPGNATTVPGVLGLPAATVVGTATARNVAVTSLATRLRRVGYVSAATAGSLAEVRFAAAQYSAGSGSNDGSGFFLVMRFVPSNAASVAGERAFAGMMNSTSAATNVEPSTLTNCVGIAQLSTDNTQWYLVYGGSAAQTAIALGTALGAPTGASTTAWELAIYAPPLIANTFKVQVTNLLTKVTVSQTLTGNSVQLPQYTTLLAPRIWKTNNATASAVAFDLASLYIETDY